MHSANFFRHHSELVEVASRGTLAVLALSQGLTPIFIDCNKTHATNPQWPGHARFHLVWQVGTSAFYGVAGAALIWWPGPFASDRFYLAAALAAFPLLAFVAALMLRTSYGGALHDPNGIAPVRIRLRARNIEIDLNAVLVIAALILLSAAVIAYWLAA